VIYAVRSGYLMTYVNDEAGREQVLGFHLPGELVGLDAIYPNRHQCNAVALDTATACTLPCTDIATLAARVPGLQKQMFRLLSRELAAAQARAGDSTAEERIAGFLTGLSDRLAARGYSAQRFRLVMLRRNIANYLRLTPETVSRVFKRFQDEEIIEVDRRDIRLLNFERLVEMAGCMPG